MSLATQREIHLQLLRVRAINFDLLAALERARNWMGAGGEWQDADASGRRVEVEQDINRQSSAAIEAAKS